MMMHDANFPGLKEDQMQANDIAILVFVVGSFSLFGGVLGWASRDESRRARRSRK